MKTTPKVIVTVRRPALEARQTLEAWLAAHPAEAAAYGRALRTLAVVVAHAAQTSERNRTNAGSTPAALPTAHDVSQLAPASSPTL